MSGGRRPSVLAAEDSPRVRSQCGGASHRDACPTKLGENMKGTQLLHNLGQSLWLDNITRDLLDTGALKRYIDELSVTGLTSNPTIFENAIKNSRAYDAPIREKLAKG